MNDPYILLGIDNDATDDQIRQAWLDKVHQFPPETDPEKFRMYRDAYEKIDTQQKRCRQYLFSHECTISSPFQSLLAEQYSKAERQPPSFEQFEDIINRIYVDLYTNDTKTH
ncbi:MAG: hypothetical protein GX640_24415 [Fibrobacter sp.]|nr:hypothetical protein [Fibrobacter sp.]